MPTPIHLGRDSRDSAGDDLSTHYYKSGDDVIAEHWGHKRTLTPAQAIAELEKRIAESLAAQDGRSADYARQTVAMINLHFKEQFCSQEGNQEMNGINHTPPEDHLKLRDSRSRAAFQSWLEEPGAPEHITKDVSAAFHGGFECAYNGRTSEMTDLLAFAEAVLPELESELEQRQTSGLEEYWKGLDALVAQGRKAIAKAKGASK